MISDDERKALELKAYGKRISFHTRHHWILTWLEEQPGRNLADKVWSVVNAAYKANYARRGTDAANRYYALCERFDYDNPDPQKAVLTEMLAALSEACECFQRAGKEEQAEIVRQMLGSVLFQQSKRAA